MTGRTTIPPDGVSGASHQRRSPRDHQIDFQEALT
jgi:hypothetical protein